MKARVSYAGDRFILISDTPEEAAMLLAAMRATIPHTPSDEELEQDGVWIRAKEYSASHYDFGYFYKITPSVVVYRQTLWLESKKQLALDVISHGITNGEIEVLLADELKDEDWKRLWEDDKAIRVSVQEFSRVISNWHPVSERVIHPAAPPEGFTAYARRYVNEGEGVNGTVTVEEHSEEMVEDATKLRALYPELSEWGTLALWFAWGDYSQDICMVSFQEITERDPDFLAYLYADNTIIGKSWFGEDADIYRAIEILWPVPDEMRFISSSH